MNAMKILVVDDNRENVELMADILGTTYNGILTALDGNTALKLAAEHRPDLILLDVNMPMVTGFDVCEQIKSNPATQNISIIMVTALGDVESRVRGLSLGADDYLVKPYSAKELLARVKRRLTTKKQEDALRSESQHTRMTFERFVSPQVVQRLLTNPDSVALGGQLQPVAVLFADLEGFTSLSEREHPETLLQVLNAYHALFGKIIGLYGGMIDKFIGDGVMALYNTPHAQPDYIARAVKTALHIQDELYWFHQRLEPEHRLLVNFGISDGQAVVGNVGMLNQMNFTAVGDTVNVAARLQDLATRGQILVTESVYVATQEFVIGKPRGWLNVKGRREPISVVQISNSPIED
jgi:class 3 adenylate cyclase